MKSKVSVSDTLLSQSASKLIESGLAPIFIGVDTELYDLKGLVEDIEGFHFKFSAQDESIIRDCASKADFIELSTGGHRDFKSILGF